MNFDNVLKLSQKCFNELIAIGSAIIILKGELKQMDKKIKALQKKEQSLVKDTKSLLKADKKNDKVVVKAKKKMNGPSQMKGKC